jgi:3-phenylpropionate/trans-cinnamate dioxygenase ferredoxin subunit
MIVCAAAEVPPGTAKRVVADDREIAIFNVDGELFATDDICSHEEASLSDGELDDHVVECPLHGARFDVRTGKALSLPAVRPIDTFPVRVVDGKVEVEL